jgi:hypothetical protein
MGMLSTGGVPKSMKKLSLVFFSMIIITTGCATNKNLEQSEAQSRVQMLNNQAGQDSKSRIMTQHNANVVNINGRRINDHDDINKARNVVDRTDEFESGSVWIEGNHMWVTVYKKGMMNERQKIDAEADVHRKLSVALPKYDIEVRVLEDRS